MDNDTRYILVELNWDGQSINHAIRKTREEIVERFRVIQGLLLDRNSFFFMECWSQECDTPTFQFIYFPSVGSYDAFHSFAMSADHGVMIPAFNLWNKILEDEWHHKMSEENHIELMSRQSRHHGMCMADRHIDLEKVFARKAELCRISWKDVFNPKHTTSPDRTRLTALSHGYRFFAYEGFIFEVIGDTYVSTGLCVEDVK